MIERHRKMVAAMKALRQILNEGEDVEVEVILMIAPQRGTGAAYASSIRDRRRALDVLRAQVATFEHQLGDAA